MASTENNYTAQITALNDRLRQTLGLPGYGKALGKVCMTAGIGALPPDVLTSILTTVQRFDNFTEDNDPYGEHDFGAFDCPGAGKVFWKIDYYAPDMSQGSEDPADPDKTVRVLTIMLASEW